MNLCFLSKIIAMNKCLLFIYFCNSLITYLNNRNISTPPSLRCSIGDVFVSDENEIIVDGFVTRLMVSYVSNV